MLGGGCKVVPTLGSSRFKDNGPILMKIGAKVAEDADASNAPKSKEKYEGTQKRDAEMCRQFSS